MEQKRSSAFFPLSKRLTGSARVQAQSYRQGHRGDFAGVQILLDDDKNTGALVGMAVAGMAWHGTDDCAGGVCCVRLRARWMTGWAFACFVLLAKQLPLFTVEIQENLFSPSVPLACFTMIRVLVPSAS